MNTTPENKEISLVKGQVTKALGVAQEMVIANTEDRKKATEFLSKTKMVAKMIKERKEAITKPLNEALASARDLFKPIETNLADAEQLVKTKMLAWDYAEEKRIEAAKEKIADKVEAGTMKPETAIKKMEAIGEVQTTVEGKTGQTQTRKIKKVRMTPIENLTKEQVFELWGRGYLAWNEAEVRKNAFNSELGPIPGVEVYEEKIISAR